MNPLSRLQCIDVLEVGPAEVQPRKLVCPYLVQIEGASPQSHNLSYHYDEDVFHPEDPGSQNLADLIGAQVALNYGLFCRKIRFQGLFDQDDRRFLESMTENTSREIYVNKLLEENPFLKDGFREIPPQKQETYTQAEIEFSNLQSSLETEWEPRSRCDLILSSGGKDSLLSFGLMQELGREVHPVFINESGRHWFTALNAYRFFSESIPHTGRVWSDCDRLFNWMLRHLPFIREDFNRLRADIYPIRLWTVAVFLFGVLPLMRKRRLQNLVIGDEFDSTSLAADHSIRHYDGLYDQSRYFDNALTRFYRQKKWGVRQFSVLRPLSELLIQTTLVKRYPELQSHQVSCHAAHVEDGRVRPCGRCEKCHRIVGMLTAIGADPERCGYTRDQIEYCLNGLGERGLKQERAAVQQLLFLIDRREAGKEDLGETDPGPCPEVMKLRFDRIHSPTGAIPRELRRPLYRIFLQYSWGSVTRHGRHWLPFNALSQESLHAPYPYEDKRMEGKISEPPGQPWSARPDLKSIDLGPLTWPEAEQRFKEVDLALLPVGAIEQHGPHLPLDTDSFDAEYLARQVALRSEDPKPIVLPVISYGVSYHHDDFPGTISIGNETLSRLVYEIGMSAARNGISKLVIINGHGGNDPSLNFAAQRINRDARIFVCVDTGQTSDVDIYSMTETANDVHAGEIETSTTLAVRPHLVAKERAKAATPRFSSRYLDFTSKRGVNWYAYTKRISRTGVMGDPTRASVEKGEKMWEVMISHLVAFVEELKAMTLDEIHQRRY